MLCEKNICISVGENTFRSIKLHKKVVNCSQTKFSNYISPVVFLQFFAWPISLLSPLIFRPQKRNKQIQPSQHYPTPSYLPPPPNCSTPTILFPPPTTTRPLLTLASLNRSWLLPNPNACRSFESNSPDVSWLCLFSFFLAPGS